MSTVQQAALRAAELCGGPTALARTLGERIRGRAYGANLVGQWSGGSRPIPPRCARLIEDLTAGQVPVWETRPDDWHLVWPEKVGTAGAPPAPALAANDDRSEAVA